MRIKRTNILEYIVLKITNISTKTWTKFHTRRIIFVFFFFSFSLLSLPLSLILSLRWRISKNAIQLNVQFRSEKNIWNINVISARKRNDSICLSAYEKDDSSSNYATRLARIDVTHSPLYTLAAESETTSLSWW